MASRRADPAALGLFRVILGLLLVARGGDELRHVLRDGYFGAGFHWPYLPEVYVPSKSVYLGLVALQISAGLAVAIGRFARPALVVGALCTLAPLLLDRLQFHHNRYLIVCEALLLAMCPCDERFVLGQRKCPNKQSSTNFALLLGLQVSLVYLASGGSKLFDPDWRGGLVLADRMTRYGYQATQLGIPSGIVKWAASLPVAHTLSLAAIFTEIFLAFGLQHPRTRKLAMTVGIGFHLAIEFSSRVELFSFLTIGSYLVFVSKPAQKHTIRGSAWLLTFIKRFDWLDRFECVFSPAAPSWLAVQYAEKQQIGLRALAAIISEVPCLFLFWGPVWVLSQLTQKQPAQSQSV